MEMSLVPGLFPWDDGGSSKESQKDAASREQELLERIALEKVKSEASTYKEKYEQDPSLFERDFEGHVERTLAESKQALAQKARAVLQSPVALKERLAAEVALLRKDLGKTVDKLRDVAEVVRADLEEKAAKFRQDYEDNPKLLERDYPDHFYHTLAEADQIEAKKARSILEDQNAFKVHMLKNTLKTAKTLAPAMDEWDSLEKGAREAIEAEAALYDPKFPQTDMGLKEKFPDAQQRKKALEVQEKGKRAIALLADKQKLNKELIKGAIGRGLDRSRTMGRGGHGFGF